MLQTFPVIWSLYNLLIKHTFYNSLTGLKLLYNAAHTSTATKLYKKYAFYYSKPSVSMFSEDSLSIN